MDQFIVFVLLAFVSCISGQCLTAKDDRPTNINKESEFSIYHGQQSFSLDMLRQVQRNYPTSSIFFSPYSTYHALMLAYFIANNGTEQSIKSLLRIPQDQDKIDVLQALRFEKYLRTMSETNQTYEFESANRIFVASDAGVRPCMIQLLGDEIEKVDFHSNPEAARTKINKYVEEITRDQIKELLSSESVDQQTNLILANAAYFKGMWKSQFNARQTIKSVFYISGSEKTFVDMMTQEGTFNHDVSEELGAHILELPYVGNDVSMFIFLPPFATENGADHILTNLNVTTFQEFVNEGGLYPKKVVVSMPKYVMEQSIELKSVLESMGSVDLFQNSGDFSALTGQPNLSLGDAIHKAKIEVSEEGTKSAAATALFTFRSSRPAESAMFICNHPFIYIIYDRSSQAILFVGVFRKP